MGRRQNSNKKDEDYEILNAFAQENKMDIALNVQKLVVFSLFALFTIYLPVYFYTRAYEVLSIIDYILLPGAGLIGIINLVLGYSALYKRQKRRITLLYNEQVSNSSKKAKSVSKNEESAITEKMSELGSTGYALWYTNAVFFIVVLVVGHHFLGAQPQRFSYPVSVILGGFAARYMASKTANKKRR